MYANRQRAYLRAFQDLVDLFMRQFEILTGGHLKLNQTDIIVAGDNTRTSTGGQHAFNARVKALKRYSTVDTVWTLSASVPPLNGLREMAS